MTRYSLLVSLHVASVVVWLGCGTTLAFVTMYARRAPNTLILDQLGALVQWVTVRVFAPAALAAAGFGVAAAHAGHWEDIFFFHVGEGAFVFSFLLTVGVRVPLLRRAARGAVGPRNLSQYLLALAVAELTVLYVAVADMVTKPSGVHADAVRYGSFVLVLGLAASLTIASWAHTGAPVESKSHIRRETA